MPPTLLASQMATLEPLGPDENSMMIDVTGTPTEVAVEIVSRLTVPAVHGV